MTYQTKLGKIPYAPVVSNRPLKEGETVWITKTNRFTRIFVRLTRPDYWTEFHECLVEKVNDDILFLSLI